jgi:hypothetical protein
MLNFFTDSYLLFNTNNNDAKNINKKIYTHKYDTTTKKEDYQIAICQDGKYAATFDRGKLYFF